MRFAYGLAFNEAGDLFTSDNEGGDNPTEEINYVVKGGNYGHHPKLATGPAIAPVLAITPHLSTDGIDFNPTSNPFGGTAGDLFIAAWGPDGQWSRGGILRARLTKQSDGSYKGDWHPFVEGLGKTIDVRFSPRGDLYVARFGIEGLNHTPNKNPDGDIYRVIHAPWLSPDQYVPDRTGVAVENPLLTPKLVGDPVKGKTLATQRGCINCHSIDGSGSSLGPDLTHIWSTFGQAGVLEAIKEPSKTIATNYDGYQVQTTGGDDYVGRLLSSDEDKIVLRTVDKQVEIPRTKIKVMEMMKLSMMPEGLLTGTTEADVNDLCAFLQSLPVPKERVIRMRLGGEGITADGHAWEADQPYTTGGYGSLGGIEFRSENKLVDPLIESCRFGNFIYKADLDNGTYDVTLVMGEPYFHNSGARVFSVKIQNDTVLKDIDLIREVGFDKPLRKTFPVTVTTGHLEIDLSPKADNALLSAIEIRPSEPAHAARR